MSPRLKMFVSIREVILALSDIEIGVYLQEIMPAEFQWGNHRDYSFVSVDRSCLLIIYSRCPQAEI